ncbi:KAP family P-loop NTPase fold protein [Aliarcobacter skirrowii]|uniref:P-loop NTPase fold protein n=1 Tax=Aliarcobacter skirrowii TaxID=28200 RepID=A0AAW9DAC6_9BACT|nr:P-loop NTPase fold protein [Aliarcobacter skirrowii]MDX4069155.1 P-loop NTPase fold protein [Aliarcobacter skirrowii]
MSKIVFNFKNDNKEFNDVLERRDIAKLYAKFIKNLDGHHVIALDAPWGSGKSTLIEYMSEDFTTNKDVFVQYNAWENDYTEEPLISLMSDIFTAFKDKKYIGIDKMKNQISSITKIGKKGGSAFIKGTSRALLGESASNDLNDVIKETMKIFIEDNANTLFKDIDESKKSRKKFKEELIKYTNSILKEKSKDKLIIIIDELDRCRPTFAIELLENIKHLFDIEKIIFFISVDCKQLAESIKAIYGSGFDADTYLHRFFDFELHLKKTRIVDYFYNKIKEKLNSIYFDELIEFSEDSINTFNLTIRDINKIVNETCILNILYNEANKLYENTHNTKYFLSFLILKYKDPTLYKIFQESKEYLSDKNIFNKLNEKVKLRLFFSKHLKFIINSMGDTTSNKIIEKTIKSIDETL